MPIAGVEQYQVPENRRIFKKKKKEEDYMRISNTKEVTFYLT